MKYKRVAYKEPLMEGVVPKQYAMGAHGELYEIIHEPGDSVDPYNGLERETDTYFLSGKEEYWGFETICKNCGSMFQAYNKNGESIRNYCPGCGKKLIELQEDM